MSMLRAFVAITAVLWFIAAVVAFTIADLTGGGTSDGERDALLGVFVPVAVVYVILIKVLAPEDPKKRRRR